MNPEETMLNETEQHETAQETGVGEKGGRKRLPEPPARRKKGVSRRKRRILRRVLLTLFLLLSVGAAGCYIAIKPEYEVYQAVAYEKLSGMSRSDFSLLPDTEVFDRSGSRIGLINAGHYEYVPIAEISPNLQEAYIAQEDKRFLRHNGVDWIATARAGLKLIQNGGRITQGGSTITQQVIKNTFLTKEQTFSRKIIEILMAPEIEKKYTKADIMEFYCNTNFYGNRCYGVQAASRYYFGKDVADLSVPEAATLAGISNSPSRYDPVKDPEAAREKRNRVLASMLRVGYIDEAAYNDYIAAPLVVLQDTQEGTEENYQSSYALHCAAVTLMQLDGFPFRYVFDTKEEQEEYLTAYEEAYAEKSAMLRGGGYRIYTTLDSGIQRIVQEELDRGLSGFTDLQENGKYALQGAGVVVDNRSGAVVAVVGGRGEDDYLNRAYNAARQPGSCIKPLLDYAPAFDTGEYYPARMVNDHKWENGPSNAGGGYHGDVTVRYALNKSLNTVAWQILEDIGVRNGMEYLGKMQFQKLSYIDTKVPSVSIGGFTNGVRVCDMAKAYAALANDGIYTDKTCIARIEHEQLGDITAGLAETKTRVYRDDTAWMMTDILKGSFTDGTAAGLSLAGGMPCAGKTGTTNDSKDAWFCGYSRYYTAAFWMGYDLPQAMPGIYGASYAGKIWKQTMDRLHEGLAPLDWVRPASVEERTDEATGLTDWHSKTDELRAADSLYQKEQAKELSEVKELLSRYEKSAIGSVREIEEMEALYAEIMERAGLLAEGAARTEILTRAEARHAENEKTLSGMQEELALWKKQQALIEEQQKLIRESEAAERRKEEEMELNRSEVRNAAAAVYAAEYRSAELTRAVNAAIDALSLVSGYPDEAALSAEVDTAVRYAETLPDEQSYKAQKAAEERAEAEQKRRETELTQSTQEALRDRFSESRTENGGGAGNAGPGEAGPGSALPDGGGAPQTIYAGGTGGPGA